MVMGELPEKAETVVIGGGPGGYAAAFRAAALGQSVTLATDEPELGGACLLRGCIPSKALLGVADLIASADAAAAYGIAFGRPDIDLAKLREWKDGVVEKLATGLDRLCEAHGVRRIQGRAAFDDAGGLVIEGDERARLDFKHAIIATGSRPVMPETFAIEDERIIDSTSALELAETPERLLVVGGGYIGLELGQVYAALGARVTIVEMTDSLLPGVDPDLVAPLAKAARSGFEAVRLETEAKWVDARKSGLKVAFASEGDEDAGEFDRILVAVGRRPNTDSLGLEHTDVETDDDGAIVVDERRRTADRRIYAIGDAAGGMMLAHEAMAEGRVAAEAIAGRPAAWDVRAVPAIVFTSPQVAWCGLTTAAADRQNRKVSVVTFPWKASGRALALGAGEGLTKLVLDPESGRVLGMGAVGEDAESLVAEAALAIEMGAVAEDLVLTVHAHPTFAETIGEAAELFLGQATHLPPKQADDKKD